MKRLNWYYMMMLLQLILSESKAGTVSFTSVLYGPSLALGATIETVDGEYWNMIGSSTSSSWQATHKNVQVDNFLHLKYTEADNFHYSSDWSIEVACTIERWNEHGVLQPVENCNLKIDYKVAAGTKYTNVSTWRNLTQGGHRVRATITNIILTGISSVPTDVLLENFIGVERRLDMKVTAPITISHQGGAQLGCVSSTDNILIYWSYLFGAEEYDLEWLFKSQYDGISPIDFSKASRITTTNQYYSLAAAFDNGVIIYRVRGVSKDFTTGTQRLEGQWVQAPTVILVCNIEKRNWTYNAVYAEEGKRKEVMSYFDGSGRTRQSVTLSNTEGVELVAETMFDYEGRPAIQTLPAPSKDFRGNLKFYHAFNLNASGLPYSKKDFDVDALSPCISTTLTPGMNSTPGVGNGASLYYSENNPLVNPGPTLNIPDNGFNVLIPDAEDYPFTQTVYGNDGTVKAQSGVGPNHAIKSGHETQYFNTTASQEKLDRLFGNEVGFDEHYREKVVIDPNGQISVSYEDLSGHVIATCLRGKSPSNLLPLSMPEEPYTGNNPSEKIYEHFSNVYDPASESYISSENFLVDNYSVPYQFSYVITPQDFQSLCTNTTYGCDYVLQFSLVDDCNRNLLDPANGYISAIVSNHPVTTITDLITPIELNSFNFVGTPFSLTFTINFPKNGVYRLEKRLGLDPVKFAQTISDFENNLRASPSPCIKSLNALEDAFDLVKDDEGCETCLEACDKTANEWKADHNNVWVAYPDENGNIYNTEFDFLEACKNDCKPEIPKRNCDGLLEALKADMSPGGQYFEKMVGIQPYMYNFINLIAALNQVPLNTADEFYEDFKDYVTTNSCTSLPGSPPANWHDYLSDHWDPCYEGFLAQFHPEYCRYIRCTELTSSYDFDANLLRMTYSQATGPANAYLNMPSGTHLNLVNQDPYFTKPANVLQKASMISEVNSCQMCATYFPASTLPTMTGNSMWNFAAVAPSPVSSGANALNEQWSNFAKLYTSIKQVKFVSLFPSGFATALHDGPSPDLISDGYADYDSNIPVSSNSCVIHSCAYSSSNIPYATIVANGMIINDPDPTQSFFNAGQSSNASTTNPGGLLPDMNTCLYSNSTIQINFGLNNPGQSDSKAQSGSCNPTLCQPNTLPANLLPTATNEQTLVFYAQIGKVPVNYPMNISADPSWSNGTCYIQISDPVRLQNLTNSSTLNDKIQYLDKIKSTINTYVSTPYDFTCTVNYPTISSPNSYSYKIIAPASLGPFGNPTDLKLSIAKTIKSGTKYQTQYECVNAFTTAAKENCGQFTFEVDNCLCVLIEQADEFYAAHPPATGAGSIDQAIADTINNQLHLTGLEIVLPGAIAYWRAQCDQHALSAASGIGAEEHSTLRTQAIPYIIPEKLLCGLPCSNEQADDEAEFYAQEEFDALVDAQVQNFINEYKKACLHQANLAEAFMVEYELLEYHYTLYYYDQAGNRVRTIPPSGVKRISAANLYDPNHNDKVHLARITPGSTKIYPEHSRYATGAHSSHNANLLVTNYKYNTLNQLIQQETPDGGVTNFWYNDIGQLRFSQNAKQKAKSPEAYSYTIYDGQGRIVEVGENTEMNVSGPFSTYSFSGSVNNPLFPGLDGTEVTKTYYDRALPGLPFTQEFLRKRVATVTYEDVEDNSDLTFNSGTHYNYDVDGNVNVLTQDFPELAIIHNQYKKIEYRYDLISGNVNEVLYQPAEFDQYFHQYIYDVNNRLTHVYTSNDNIHWQQDARYFYYLHGPLARVEIGEEKVQGLDYAYNLQGWIKAVNSNTLSSGFDSGKDGFPGDYFTGQTDVHKNTARDVFGYSLEFYTGDYKSIASNPATNNNWGKDITGSISIGGSTPYSTTPDLYNGNIKAMATAMYQPGSTPGALPTEINTIAKFFAYDQLQRIKEAQSYLFAPGITTLNGIAPYTAPNTSEYYESFTYDPNGNILKANRNGPGGLTMDKLNYLYDDLTKNNKLERVKDGPYDINFADDIDNQTNAINYKYDAIGNLTSDEAEGLKQIDWSVYGKILKISKGSNKENIEFKYDASGNRIQKILKPKTGIIEKNQEDRTTTYYVRDAQGNVMAIYDRSIELKANTVQDSLLLKETHIYGSSRLGIEIQDDRKLGTNAWNYSISGHNADGTLSSSGLATNTPIKPNPLVRLALGNKRYELSNHLGNVNVVISDRKFSVPITGSSLHDFYLADAISNTDYFAFGAEIAGRSNISKYRYGFNGKENDDEVKGISGSQQDYGMRIYDCRLAKFLSEDPLTLKYPFYSTYQFAGNNPVFATDLDGAEPNPKIYAEYYWYLNPDTDQHHKYKTTGQIIYKVDSYWVYVHFNSGHPGLNKYFYYESSKEKGKRWTQFYPKSEEQLSKEELAGKMEALDGFTILAIGASLAPFALVAAPEISSEVFLKMGIETISQLYGNYDARTNSTYVDVPDVLFTGFLPPWASNIFGGIIDGKLYTNSNEFKIKTVFDNKSIYESLYDTGTKYLLNTKGPMGKRILNKTNNLSPDESVHKLFEGIWKAGTKRANAEVKKKVFGS